MYDGSREFKESATSLTFIKICIVNISKQANFNTGVEYIYISNPGGQEYKTRKCSRWCLCKTHITCLYQLLNADTFKLVHVYEQTWPWIESHLHFMEKNENFLGLTLHRITPRWLPIYLHGTGLWLSL